jgi:3-mercaptopyruvate sulfurtransferase SseA
VVFTSSDGMLATLAAADARKAASAPVLALDGGTEAWRRAGLPLERGEARMATAPDDVRLRARDQAGNVEDAMRAYLSWEIALAAQMAADDDQRFRILAR